MKPGPWTRIPAAALAAAALTTVALAGAAATAAAEPGPCERSGAAARALVTESRTIPSDTPGIALYLRNKRPADMRAFPPERIVLFVHGATYPAETAFDLALDGFSWMDYLACRGFDVYLVDLRGYGRSTRPPEMAQPAEANPPIVTTAVAVADVGAAVDWIRNHRRVERLNLLGWSWGTTIMATYAAANPERVGKLALYAPLWLRSTPLPLSGQLGAYRTVTQEQAKKRWLNGVAPDRQGDLIPPGWFEAWAQATWETDPDSGKSNPPQLRAPNGVLQDVRDYWSAGRPYYDPAAITAATLLIHAEWDQDTPGYMAQALFPLLTSAAAKRLVVIGAGTHTVVMEKNRMQLLREVQLFLEE